AGVRHGERPARGAHGGGVRLGGGRPSARAEGRGHAREHNGAPRPLGDMVVCMTSGRVALAATPIGNPADGSARLRGLLPTAALEVTVPGRVMSFYEHNESGRVPQLVERVRSGDVVAVVTDAGMPSVSDPGYSLTIACIEAGLPVTCLPGPSAVTTALVLSGL